jgi:hypothetical protein
MKEIIIGWGFGRIYSKDNICFSGNGVVVCLFHDDKIDILIKEVDNWLFTRINEILKIELPKYTSEEIISQGRLLIEALLIRLKAESCFRTGFPIIENIRDWTFEPPEEFRDLYMNKKLKDVAEVDIDKLYQIRIAGEIAKDANKPLSLDFSNEINVNGDYINGDVKTIHGDEINGNGQKININDSVLVRSGIGNHTKNICPTCSMEIHSGWKVCPSCGNRI